MIFQDKKKKISHCCGHEVHTHECVVSMWVRVHQLLAYMLVCLPVCMLVIIHVCMSVCVYV